MKNKPTGLHEFRIRSGDGRTDRVMTATSGAGAWAKFVTLYCGRLKPARTDYTITAVPSVGGSAVTERPRHGAP